LKIVKKYIFNKNKKDTIILIHGLYTSSGFWLSFFNYFKNYRIIAFDINYEKLLRSEYIREILKATFEEDGHIVGVISHSFGTVISDLVFDYENDKIYKICPVAFSKRIEPNNFVLDILNKTQLTQESIVQNIKLVNTFVSRMRDSLNCNGQIYIPTDDSYFIYDVPQKNKIQFVGDHFNISNALNDIINNL
jgi:hypothetical protein